MNVGKLFKSIDDLLTMYGLCYQKFMNELFIINYHNIPNSFEMCGFPKAHSTYHELFKLLHSWQKKLDKDNFAGTILIDRSSFPDMVCNKGG